MKNAGHPSETVDPIDISSEITMALQTVASRSIDPREVIVVWVTRVLGGIAYNVIPSEVVLSGAIRSLRRAVERVATIYAT